MVKSGSRSRNSRPRMTPMVLKFFNKISECLARAADLRELANAATTTPARKAELLKLESQLLNVVESYRLMSRTGRFREDEYARWSARMDQLAQTSVEPVGVWRPTGQLEASGS